MTYGALAIQEEETQQVASFKKTVAIVFAATCLVGAVVGMSTLAANRSVSAVNANRNKGLLAAVPGVAEKTAEVLNMTVYNLRWAVFGFVPCCTFDQNKACSDCKMIPTVQGKASADWSEDFEAMTNVIDDLEIAAVVYNFEYFTGPKETAIKPILITYANPTANAKTLARGGYYLGSLFEATRDITEHYPIDAVADYQSFCTGEMQIPRAMCEMEGDFRNCPFENGICEDPVCASAVFSNPDETQTEGSGISDECCSAMKGYCESLDGAEDAGCHPTRLRAVSRLCAVDDADETPELILPEDEVQLCDEQCVQPCAFLEDDEDNKGFSFKFCSDCNVDGLADPRLGDRAAQCYPGAIGFVEKRCCGINDACKAGASQSEMACASLDGEEYNCLFIEHKDCPEVEFAQSYALAPIGCCDGTDGINQMDCEGLFLEGDCPAVEEPAAEEAE